MNKRLMKYLLQLQYDPRERTRWFAVAAIREFKEGDWQTECLMDIPDWARERAIKGEAWQTPPTMEPEVYEV